ncbi:S8 family serine peptidase [Marilutibacter chinensis]|uniref:S8 family serine peptidase n=1 Tax=Marilutibacter chinensis TaxID=2912247 RepID=UPI00272E4F58|nr:S8 family serine peptidase [Lysobacter chinensis]
MATKAARTRKQDSPAAPIRVSVHDSNGLPWRKKAEVELAAGKTRIALKRVKDTAAYEGRVAPGDYRLLVKATGMVAPERSVTVAPTGKTASVYLGKRGWPFYRYGENLVPFEPREDLVAVGFDSRAPDPQRGRELFNEIVKKLGLKPVDLKAEDESHPSMAAGGAIWLFQLGARGDRAKAEAGIRRMLGEDARIGMPVDLTQRQVKVLDRRFVVRFRDHLRPKDIEALVEKAKARILRGFLQAGNARLIEFAGGTYQEHLKTIEAWYARDLLVYGEPDLIAEIVDDVFPADPPDDPTYANQANLTLQNVDDAWQFLNGISANLTLGSPAVYVATLDRGIDTDHPDIGGNLTDGTAQLAQCYDFEGLRPCTTPGYAPDTSHGMGVYGIVAARTDNANDIAGIAPNTHQIGLERPLALGGANYADALLWAAGFTTGNTSTGWPAEPINPAADIISCSHGVNGLALSGLMDDTLTFLSVYGRGGKGTLMIYSAGNNAVPQQITGYRVWAAHPRTLAISNSNQPDGMGVERLNNTSNFGPEIDICAQGNGAPSLNHTGGEQTFGGTSAAAPTVAAAAALMLSVEPDLTWVDLRDLLRNTAVVIDGANTDPVGQWSGGFSWWYGFGRLDVNAAVQGADAFDPGTVNLVVRDNLADDGSLVPTGGTFWRSPDLWVRQDNPATDPIGDPAYGANPPNQPAAAGADNWVRVRVRNAGSAPSANAFVRVYLTHFAGTEFVYPADYIPTINSGDPIPSPLVQGTYILGEQMIASLGAGADTILDFPWPAALVPPEFVGGTRWHPCLLAEISPHTGPTPSGNLVIDNTNLAQRNVSVDYSDDDGAEHEMTGVIGAESNDDRVRRIVVPRGNLSKKARIWVRFLDPKVERAVTRMLADSRNPSAPPQDGHGSCCCTPADQRPTASDVRVETVNGRKRFVLNSGSALSLDVPMVGGSLTPVVLGAQLPKGSLSSPRELPLIEYDTGGRVLGAFSLELRKR